ncbi:YbfB/YjiJ family MFS transporter [Paraburkholderia sp. LEh10]|uniref:YbfB/YjiJ family MFS transporter n=1 Tax=Paraburkholderia sp. LEh10 TaxID=2821353 RepID=UPI001AEAC6EB|nr:YbfB/YjiJ family MFS transporter [Paraburkholderia sp. LEh10]MBP0590614.1 YbfB/YjiJ family MFS transporter [Paraburkholderia sp. LEh10]
MSFDASLSSTSVTGRAAVWWPIFAGFSASLVGIGLARFAYTPLIPPLIQAHWFAASDVVYLGAANLAGYLLGALLGRPVAHRLTNALTLRAMMVLVTVAFLACAFPVSVAWFFFWRLLSGVAGGTIMVLVAATVLPHVPADRKGLASGAIFLGLGVGIAASGTLVPLLLSFGLRNTWIGIAVLSAALTLATWRGWPSARASQVHQSHAAAVANTHDALTVRVLYAEYALMALGLVPTMVFLVDFIARGLGAGAHVGASYWILYGAGAIFGAPVYGFIADRFGGRFAVRTLSLLQIVVVAAFAMSSNQIVIGVLTLVVGSFPPGIVPMMLARVHEVVPHDHAEQHRVWSRVTTTFAAFQAIAGYAYSAIFNASGGNHRLLFAIGAVALVWVLIVDYVAPHISRERVAGENHNNR